MGTTIDITEILKLAISLIALLLTTFLLPAVREFLKSRISEEEFRELTRVVRIGVQAAEQIFKGSGRGAEKKAHVLEFLEGQGYTADLNMIDEMIEAEVRKINGG